MAEQLSQLMPDFSSLHWTESMAVVLAYLVQGAVLIGPQVLPNNTASRRQRMLISLAILVVVGVLMDIVEFNFCQPTLRSSFFSYVDRHGLFFKRSSICEVLDEFKLRLSFKPVLSKKTDLDGIISTIFTWVINQDNENRKHQQTVLKEKQRKKSISRYVISCQMFFLLD